ncbi:glycogen debranching protein [Methanosarcina sp. KYL-1]|uniref:amylo-alpha-1,6-glucosidase n=1 Tax=Methanosarcina sp. KYL-1 TaxID=2602068 RepID=UPI002100D692|nr:amylo-alpha-1,6-glucosidase [Methanosarcina sp. KYL-1]MCQ1535408.1 glycogen debranching protein [Methanosarcina sp. KYL-1]
MSGIRLGADSFSSYEAGIKKEWVIGNGLGGYASSTVIGAGARTYHGLLVAAPRDSPGRVLLLSSLDEELSRKEDSRKEEAYRLATHKYPGTVSPTGFNYLSRFVLDPFPIWVFRAGDFTVKKKVFMVYGRNTTVILYEVSCRKEGGFLRLYPLVNSRSFHGTTRSQNMSFSQEAERKGIRIESSNGSVFWLSSNLHYRPDPRWYYNFEYDTEKQRGLAFQEDNFNPGCFESQLDQGTSRFFVAASTEDISSLTLEVAEELYTRAVYRQNLLAFNSRLTEPFALKLLRATDAFIVKQPATGEKTVIAGYPWFSDWGRDAMISLPGLALITRRFEDARSILENFARHCRKGLIPNSFPAFGGEAIYNTVDASLWFIHVLGRYFAYTKDLVFLSDVWSTVDDIIENYWKGTDFGIGMDSDYLIRQGPQLTWMDAKIGDFEVTPREGKACEINALWYNALKTASQIGNLLGKDVAPYETLAAGAASNFEELFWNPDKNCLFDLVSLDKGGNQVRDPAVRPNQILAVALPYTMLSSEKEKAIVDRVEQDLLTPFGLRTLSRDHPSYIGRYQGDPRSRDLAYHNGTVWPWLVGAYVKAYRKVHNYSKESLENMRALIKGFDMNLESGGIGTISEVFDGDYPYTPGGCIAQAWSVAEVLRAYVEDVLGIKP